MRKNLYFILILIMIFSLNIEIVQAELRLTYNLDKGFTERKFNLDSGRINLYIPEFHVKGIYVTGWAAGSAIMNDLIELAENTVINTMVIDIKDQDGYISYKSSVPLAKDIGANKHKIRNPKALIERLHSKGIYTIARIAVFKDDLLAKAREDLALKLYDSEKNDLYRSSSWLDPANRDVWEYNLMLAKEAVALGFDEVQFDYIRYPALGNSSLIALIPELKSKSSYINEFVQYCRNSLLKLDIPLSVDVFGLTTAVHDDMGIGQNFRELSDIINIISPMVYPSHYSAGIYGIDLPDKEPYKVVYRSLYDARRKVEDKEDFIIRPWLQDFSLKNPYTEKEILAQIKAAESLGLKEWLLWNPGSRYTEEAVKGHHFK